MTYVSHAELINSYNVDIIEHEEKTQKNSVGAYLP